MPRYTENPLVIPFSMFCAGISQNSEHHHLTLSKGQVRTDKSYLELCDNNFIKIAYDTWYDDWYDCDDIPGGDADVLMSVAGRDCPHGCQHKSGLCQPFLAL